MLARILNAPRYRSAQVAAAAAVLSMTALTATASMHQPALAYDKPTVKVDGVWARPSIGNTGKSAAYMTISNSAAKEDVLTAAKGTVSETIELHTHIKDGEIMRMRRVEGGVKVPANETVTFKPGGLHVMLIGLKSKLKVGDSFPLTLVFKEAGEVQIDVPVKKMEARGSGHHMQHKQ